MSVFTATFSAVAVTAAQDIFSILAPATCRVRIRDIKLMQYSDFGDAQAEILSVLLIYGNTVAGSVGTAVTPNNLHPWTSAVATATVRANDTTPASGGTPLTLVADGWNVASGWSLRDSLRLSDDRINLPTEGIWIERGGRLCVRITAPADSLTCNGTLVFEEGI
jgi:hypothetical protein